MAIIIDKVGDIFSSPSKSILIRKFQALGEAMYSFPTTSFHRRLQRPWTLGRWCSRRIQAEISLRLPNIQRTLPLTARGLQTLRQTAPSQPCGHDPAHSPFLCLSAAASVQDASLYSVSVHLARLRAKGLASRGDTAEHKYGT